MLTTISAGQDFIVLLIPNISFLNEIRNSFNDSIWDVGYWASLYGLEKACGVDQNKICFI